MLDSAEFLLSVQLMDHNLIVPSGAIIVDNSLMKVGLTSFFCCACKCSAGQ